MDQVVFQNLYSLTNFSPFFDGLIIFLAKTLPYLVFLYFLYLLYKLNKKDSNLALKTTLFTIATTALSRGIIIPIVHFLTQRPRPFIQLDIEPLFIPLRDTAMPSGHATFFFLLATVAFFKFSTKHGSLLYFCAAAISISRVIAGVHWPSDILIGTAIGIAVALTIEILFRFLNSEKI